MAGETSSDCEFNFALFVEQINKHSKNQTNLNKIKIWLKFSLYMTYISSYVVQVFICGVEVLVQEHNYPRSPINGRHFV